MRRSASNHKRMNLVETARKMTIGKTAVTRTVWLVVAALSFGLLAAASPLRYQMLLDDAYGYGASLSEIGLSLRFFAIYFTFFEHDFCTLKTNTPNSKKTPILSTCVRAVTTNQYLQLVIS